MNGTVVTVPVARVRAGRGGATVLRVGAALPPVPVGRVPQVARLMALAIRCEQLLQTGEVASQTAMAQLGRVTRARMTQILNLLHLAPDIQEAILFWPVTVRGRNWVKLADLQSIAARLDWHEQRRAWQSLMAAWGSGPGTVKN